MFHFVYKTTNLVNGKYYIGKRSASTLSGSYLGSGIALKAAIKKYGKKNFKREILKKFSNSKEAYSYEAKIVTRELIRKPECYNMKLGGRGAKLNQTTNGTKCIIDGITYPSYNSAAKALGISNHTAKARATGVVNKLYNPCTIKGVNYPSYNAAARALNIWPTEAKKLALKDF